MVEKTKVVHMEHFDQNESNGNAATKYIVEFSGRVNCDWLWLVLEKALVLAQQDKVEDLQTATNKASAPGCKRCGGRVTHGGYCASCHESYYP